MEKKVGWSLTVETNVEVNKQKFNQASKLFDDFYKKYNDKKMQIDTSDMVNVVKKSVSVIRELFEDGTKESTSWINIRPELKKQFEGILSDAESMFSGVKTLFNDGSYVSGLTNTLAAFDKQLSIVFSDIGGKYDELNIRQKKLANTFGDDTLYGHFDKSDMIDRIDLLRELIQVQSEMERINPSLQAKDFAIGFNTKQLKRTQAEYKEYLTDMENYNLQTLSQLQRRKDILSSVYDMPYMDWDYEQDRETENYSQAISALTKYIQERKTLIGELQKNEHELFSVDGIDEHLAVVNENISTYENWLNEFKRLRGDDNGGATIPYDFTEIVDQLKAIKDAINDIRTAFEPLTSALSADNSALHKMLTTSIDDLNTLEAKLGEVYSMIGTISTKQFNVQNIISSGNSTQNDLEQIRAFRQEAKELYKQVEQLYNIESTDTFNALKGAPGGIEKILNYQQLMSDFDLADLAKRIKSRSATSLGIVIDELNEWKKVLLQFNNLRNNIETGSFNISQYNSTSSKVQIGSKKTDKDEKQVVDKSSVDNTDVLNKIKSLGEQMETKLVEIRSRIEETFNLATVEINHEHITSIIDTIYQQFVDLQAKIGALDLNLSVPAIIAQVDERDAKQTVVQATDDDSVSASTHKIDAEAQAMQDVAAEATQAAQAKEKFANANKKVAKTAEETSQKVKEETQKMEEAAGAIVEASDKFDKVKYVEDVDGVPMSKTTTSTTTRENAIETESSYYTRDANGDLQLSTVTLVRDFKKRAAELKKESDKIALAQKTVDKFISQFESKTAGQASTIKGFDGKDGLKNVKIGNLDDIEKATQAMLDLDNEYNKITKNFRQGTKSMNPFVNAITGIDEMGNKITEAKIAFDSLNTKPDKLSKDIAALAPLFKTMKSYISTDADGNKTITDIYGLSEAYGKLNVALRQVNSDIKIQKKTDDAGIKSEKEQVNAYEKTLKSQEKYYNIKKKMVELDLQSTKGQETLRKLTKAQNEYNDALSEQNKLTVGQRESVRAAKHQQETELSTLQQEHKSKISTEQEEKDLKYILSLYKEYTDAALSLKKMQSDTDTTGAVHTDKQTSAIKTVQEAKEKLLALGIDVNKISESELLTEKQINALLEERAKYKKQVQNIEDTANDKVATKENKQNQNYGKTIYNRESRYYDNINANLQQLESDATLSDGFSQKIDQYKAAFQELQNLRNKIANDNSISGNTELKSQFQSAALGVEQMRKEITATIKESQRLASISDDIKLGSAFIDGNKFSSASEAMLDFASTVTHGQFKLEGFNAAGTEMYGVMHKASGVVEQVTVALDESTNAMYAYQSGTRRTSNSWDQLGATLKSSAAQLARMYLSFHDIIRVTRQGINEVKEIDAALTELKKVTDATEESYDKFLQTMSQSASRTGSTVKELTTSAADWARLGYSMQDAGMLAENTAILMNVSEFDNITNATDTLVSALQAYKEEGSDVADLSMEIINKYNEVGNSYAISTSDLANSLTRSSATLVAAGNSLSESIALTTAANATIQDPNAVGNALKVVAMRIRGTTAKILEDMGEDTDGLVESTSKLQEKIQALTSVNGGKGVNILTDDGSYKTTYEILVEISKVFDEIDDKSQAALLELLAGKQRGSVVAAILQNGEMLQNVYASAEDAGGSAMHELDTYMQSIQGRIDVFNNALQTMWMNLIDSDTIKGFVDFGTKVMKFLDTAPGKITAIVAALAGIAKFKGLNIINFIPDAITALKQTTQLTTQLSAITSFAKNGQKGSIASILGTGEDLQKHGAILNAYANSVKGLSEEEQAEYLI